MEHIKTTLQEDLDKNTQDAKVNNLKASVGRVVLYMKYGTPGGEHKSEVSPAVITKVLNEETQECQLFVMNPNGLYFNSTPYAEELTPGHWSWMPYQKQQAVKRGE